METREERIARMERKAKAEAQCLGHELLTPRATAELFGKSSEAVRAAARAGNVEAPFEFVTSGKPVRLIRLVSAIEYWAKPNPDRLAHMRKCGHVTFIANADGGGGLTYNILHPEPLIRLVDADV